uniref:Uncharacterized protein n=1 Tax=Eutreptiella gymnastica TaxID=73025 RepID=A0A7S4GAX7_9EUGL
MVHQPFIPSCQVRFHGALAPERPLDCAGVVSNGSECAGAQSAKNRAKRARPPSYVPSAFACSCSLVRNTALKHISSSLRVSEDSKKFATPHCACCSDGMCV